MCAKNGVTVNAQEHFYAKILPSIFGDVTDILCTSYSNQDDCDIKKPEVFNKYLAIVSADKLPPRRHTGVAYGALKFVERLANI